MNATVWTLNRNDNTESLLKTHSTVCLTKLMNQWINTDENRQYGQKERKNIEL